MQFVRRVRTIWSWLPAFRAVAETEHLPTAATELGIVPSSLSRTIKLLEDELGLTLFERTSKSLVLNDAGKTLLAAVREGMRIVDDAIGAATSDTPRGQVTAMASADLAHAILIPACRLLAERHADLCMTTRLGDLDPTGALIRGDADVALALRAPADPELRSFELLTWTRGVYARAGTTVATSPRCVVSGTPETHDDDGWPAGCERGIAAWTPDERAALALVAESDLVTVAYDALAADVAYAGRVVRLPEFVVESRKIFVVHRRAIGAHSRTDAVIDAIRAAIA